MGRYITRERRENKPYSGEHIRQRCKGILGLVKTGGDNPLANVLTPKLSERLPKVISEKEMIVIFDSLAQNPRETALLLLLDSGITLSEVAELDDSYVDTARGTVRVFREKTQKERYAYFSPPTGAAIETYRFG